MPPSSRLTTAIAAAAAAGQHASLPPAAAPLAASSAARECGLHAPRGCAQTCYALTAWLRAYGIRHHVITVPEGRDAALRSKRKRGHVGAGAKLCRGQPEILNTPLCRQVLQRPEAACLDRGKGVLDAGQHGREHCGSGGAELAPAELANKPGQLACSYAPLKVAGACKGGQASSTRRWQLPVGKECRDSRRC